MPLLREGPGVTIIGVRTMFIATEDTRVAALEFGAEGIKGVSWRRASPLDPRPPTPPAIQVEAVLLEFDGIRVETADPNILANLHDPEWRAQFAQKAQQQQSDGPTMEAKHIAGCGGTEPADGLDYVRLCGGGVLRYWCGKNCGLAEDTAA